MTANDVAAPDAERDFREREIAVKERELEFQMQTHRSAWKSPLVVAILAAAVAAAGNALVAYTNDRAQTRLEAQKAESARILEMIGVGNPDKAADNLKFLLRAGLITTPSIKRNVQEFLRTRKPGTGPSLPAASTTQQAPSVDYYRQQVLGLLKVKLSESRVAALTDFAYNVGLGSFQQYLLPLVNQKRFDEVPDELMRFNRGGGTVIPALTRRRRAEVALWNKG